DSCQSRGLYEGFDSLSSFKEKLYRHLQLKINDHEYFKSDEVVTQSEIVDSKTNKPHLTNEGKILLKEVSQDRNGTIMHLRHLGGTNIQSNGKNFIESNERRDVALWESAIDELTQNDFIVERGHKGEIFEITNLGYQIADMIEL
ncbi:MAG: DUF4062 domain-containing protein, partial [Flavobacteriaceae bacterium]|nr:DUF4062 domain-containing protein [Flavobacteriaceae bacterium]